MTTSNLEARVDREADVQSKSTVLKVPIRKALYWKLILSLFVVSLFITGLQFLGYRVLQDSFFDKLDQTVFWELAQEFEHDVRDYTAPVLQREKVERTLLEYQRINPKVDIYLLDRTGRIFLSQHLKDRESVPLQPILEFINANGYPWYPIYGLNPRIMHKKVLAPISAAPIRLPAQDGFVYVVLRSSLYRQAYHTFGDLWLSVLTGVYLFILVLAGCALGMIFFYLITKRFRILTLAIKRFTNGDYLSRVSDHSDDELGLHGRAFNEMAETIQKNIGDLEENDRLRRELIANVSHDIRTPLAAMQTLLESLQSQYSSMSHEDQMRFVERALANCGELSGLVDDLFELSKLEARTREPELHSIQLREFLPNVAKKFAIKAEDKELDLILRLSDGLPMVLADEKMLNRAIGNLVENAIRYTEAGGQVKIEAFATKPGAVTISVSDTGVGIPEEDLKTIFDRFYRGSRVSEMEKSGFGLGLAITKRIMDLHSQDISVQSTMGKGSIFSVTLAAAKH